MRFLTLLARTALPGMLLTMLTLACQKDEQYYAGTSRLQGTVYFENGLTGTLDTAYQAQLRLYPTSGDTANTLVYKLATGRFDIPTLDGGQTYTLAVRLDRRSSPNQPFVAYQVRRTHVATTGSLDTVRLILQPSLLGQTGLRLSITDANGYRLPQAQVYLFADSVTYRRNRRTGAGSLASGRTNIQGQVLFLNLQPKVYYASVLRIAGNDTLSNSPAGRAGTTVALNASTAVPNYLLALTSTAIIGAPALQLTTTTASGYLLANTQVCLYTDAIQITRKGLSCVNSLRSGTTNGQGQVFFQNLQNRTYYVLAINILGQDTLTNLLGTKIVGPLPTTGTLVPAAIQLRP